MIKEIRFSEEFDRAFKRLKHSSQHVSGADLAVPTL